MPGDDVATTGSTTLSDERVPMYCWIDENGNRHCSNSGGGGTAFLSLLGGLRNLFNGVGRSVSDDRLKLILQAAEVVVDSPLTDSCLTKRAGDAIGSFEYALGTAAPNIFMYMYHPTPAEIMAAYYLNKARYREMHKVLEDYDTLKPLC